MVPRRSWSSRGVKFCMPASPRRRSQRVCRSWSVISTTHRLTCHEFPLALEDDTRFTVLLRAESHVNQLEAPEHPWDARGPDLERFDMAARRGIWLTF